MLILTRPLPKDAVEKFAAQALPPVEYLKDDPLFGWVTGRHLMDRDIDEESARWGGILRLALVKAEKKIPNSLLKAEVREFIYMGDIFRGLPGIVTMAGQFGRDRVLVRSSGMTGDCAPTKAA